MSDEYWENEAKKIRIEIKEKYFLFNVSLKLEKIKNEIENKNINDLKSVIEYLNKENYSINKDDFQDFFVFGRIPISPDKIKSKQILNLVNIIGLQILKYSLFKVQDKSIAINYLFDTFLLQNIIENFKNDILLKINENIFENNSIEVKNFYLFWDEKFRQEAVEIYNIF